MTREYIPFSKANLRFIHQAGPNSDEPGVEFEFDDYDIDISVNEIREMIRVVEEGTGVAFEVHP